MKSLLTLTLSACLLSLSSCGHIYTKAETYQKAPGVVVNGASVSSAVQPQGDDGSFSLSAMVYMAGSAKLKGPFFWRVEAEGQENVQTKLTIHRIKVTTETTKRDEWFPQDRLGSVAFKPDPKQPGKTFAAFQLPGKLEVYSDKDGPFTVTADISISTTSRTERKLLKFRMQPATEKGTEFLFLPTEVAKGWNRSPREWDWRSNPLN